MPFNGEELSREDMKILGELACRQRGAVESKPAPVNEESNPDNPSPEGAVLELHERNRTVRILSAKDGIDITIAVTADQEFTYLLVLVENLRLVVKFEDLREQMAAKLGFANFNVSQIRKRLCNRFIEQGVPKKLLNAIFQSYPRLGHMLKADVNFL